MSVISACNRNKSAQLETTKQHGVGIHTSTELLWGGMESVLRALNISGLVLCENFPQKAQ